MAITYFGGHYKQVNLFPSAWDERVEAFRRAVARYLDSGLARAKCYTGDYHLTELIKAFSCSARKLDLTRKLHEIIETHRKTGLYDIIPAIITTRLHIMYFLNNLYLYPIKLNYCLSQNLFLHVFRRASSSQFRINYSFLNWYYFLIVSLDKKITVTQFRCVILYDPRVAISVLSFKYGRKKGNWGSVASNGSDMLTT